MAKKTREQIKERFKNGLKPDQVDFAHIVDSSINFDDDSITVKDGNIGIRTTDPKAALHVYDNATDFVEIGTIGATLMVGKDDGHNLSFDNNEVIAKNGAENGTLHLQANGGDVRIYDRLDETEKKIVFKETGRIGVGTRDPQVSLQILTRAKSTGTGVDDEEEGTGLPGLQTSFSILGLEINFEERAASLSAGVVVGDEEEEYTAILTRGMQAVDNGIPAALNLNPLGGNITHEGSVIHSSDKRLKDEVTPLDKGLNEVLALNPVSFKWKAETGNEQDLKYGFIAQEVEKVVEEITYTNSKTGMKGIAHMELIPVLVNAIKEQNKKMNDLEARMAKLEKMMAKK